MGLNADILEANLERDYEAHTRSLFYPQIRRYEYEQSIKRYHDAERIVRETIARSQIESQSYARENSEARSVSIKAVQFELAEHRKQLIYEASLIFAARTRSIVRNRAILRIQNASVFSSRIIREALLSLQKTAQETRALSDELLEKLDDEVYSEVSAQPSNIDDDAEHKLLISSVLQQAYRYISDSTHIIDHSDFRMIESDCSKLIRMIEEHLASESRAVVFSTYLKRNHQVRETEVHCPSCRHAMFSGIPNCLFCYERR